MIDFQLLIDLEHYNVRRKDYFKRGIDTEFIPFFDSFLNARYSKVSRIKKRMVYLLTHTKYHYFITFTFDDSMLSKCERTKRDSIKDCLSSFDDSSLYILNVDFGSQKERQHFHCVYGTNSNLDFFTFLKLSYHSIFWLDRLHIDYSSDIKKICKYINKLSNHANKQSTRDFRIVYNFKGFDNLDPFLAKVLYTQSKYKLGL